MAAEKIKDTNNMAHKLRIKFSKYAHMIFIGHLDLMRYFQKAMRRANVDISYSTGFSPHQIMSFAQPLGVGVYSNGEYVDISVESLTSSVQVKDALQDVMAEGVDILSVGLLPEGAQNSMASIAAASYSVRFREDHRPQFDLASVIEAFYAQPQIIIEKETKKGTRELDLKEHIFEISYDAEQDRVKMLLDASSGGNIKPGLVMEQIYKLADAHLGEFDLLVTREDMFTNLAKENETPNYVSLESIGEQY